MSFWDRKLYSFYSVLASAISSDNPFTLNWAFLLTYLMLSSRVSIVT